MIEAATLRAIIECDTDSLRTLANVAGGHPASFFRGANFDHADLRGEDLRGFNLRAASFKHTRIDRNTRVDGEYEEIVGIRKREKIEVIISPIVFKALKINKIIIEDPPSLMLGDFM